MDIKNLHNFLFHPFSAGNSPLKSGLSMLTGLALTVLTGGAFAVAFIIVSLRDHRICRQEASPKIHRIASPILSPSSPRSIVDQVKVDLIKKKQSEQLKLFEDWAKGGQWKNIHEAHYDWWMFPVDKPSMGHGSTYAIGENEIKALQHDKAFMDSYRRGVSLVVQAWGWELETGRPISNPGVGQKWTGYGVRLAKMSDSLRLFSEVDLHKKLQLFFTKHCVPQIDRVPISNLDWVNKTLIGLYRT